MENMNNKIGIKKVKILNNKPPDIFWFILFMRKPPKHLFVAFPNIMLTAILNKG